MMSFYIILEALAQYRLSFGKFCLPQTASTVEELSTKDRYSKLLKIVSSLQINKKIRKFPNTLKCLSINGWQPTYRELLNMDYRFGDYFQNLLFLTLLYFGTSKSLPSVFDKFTADTWKKTYNLSAHSLNRHRKWSICEVNNRTEFEQWAKQKHKSSNWYDWVGIQTNGLVVNKNDMVVIFKILDLINVRDMKGRSL